MRRDIDLLGRVLGRVIVEQEGEGLLGAEEEIRSLCKRLRFRYEPDLDERLRKRIERMNPWELSRIVRAFSAYFQLVNVAERYHRIRRGRQYDAAEDGPQPASVKSALRKLAREEEEGVEAEESLGRVLDGMDLSLVLTAHPTETLRVGVRRKHLRVARILDRLDLNRLTPRERAAAEKELAEEVTLLWQTDELRAQRPDVEGEIRRTLTFFENSLIEATLEVYRDFEDELRRLFPESRPSLRPVMRFGSWVGGDQDSNPYVRPETMLTALRLQRDLIINRHRDTALFLARHLTQSVVHREVSEELLGSLEKDEKLLPEVARSFTGEERNEPYHRKMLLVAERLRRTLDDEHGDSAAPPTPPPTRAPPNSKRTSCWSGAVSYVTAASGWRTASSGTSSGRWRCSASIWPASTSARRAPGSRRPWRSFSKHPARRTTHGWTRPAKQRRCGAFCGRSRSKRKRWEAKISRTRAGRSSKPLRISGGRERSFQSLRWRNSF